MSDNIILSFCIPTYNFGKFIRETLTSITSQMKENMEIVIVDGGSTDATEEIVAGFQKEYRNIRFHKCEKRGGIDRDLSLCVSLARGRYCWFFSADDVLKKGVVDKLLSQWEEGVDVYLVGLTLCGLDINNVLMDHIFSEMTSEQVIDLSHPKERLSYFEKAKTTTAFFSFISALIVNREKWESTAVDERFYGNCWTHVMRLFSMIPKGLKLKFIPEPYLLKRGDNDSFMEHGAIHRAAISIDGFHEMGNALFGESEAEAFHFRRAVRHEFSALRLLARKRSARTRDERRRLDQLVKKNFTDFSLKNISSRLLYSVIPVFALPALQRVWRIIKSH